MVFQNIHKHTHPNEFISCLVDFLRAHYNFSVIFQNRKEFRSMAFSIPEWTYSGWPGGERVNETICWATTDRHLNYLVLAPFLLLIPRALSLLQFIFCLALRGHYWKLAFTFLGWERRLPWGCTDLKAELGRNAWNSALLQREEREKWELILDSTLNSNIAERSPNNWTELLVYFTNKEAGGSQIGTLPPRGSSTAWWIKTLKLELLGLNSVVTKYSCVTLSKLIRFHKPHVSQL